MSTYWGIRCKTCGISHIDHNKGNHQEDAFEEMVSQRRLICAIYRLAQRAGGDVSLTFGSIDIPVDFAFFLEHEGHELAVVNEYEQYNRLCGHLFMCAKCGEGKCCTARVSVDPARHRHYHSPPPGEYVVHYKGDEA